MSRTIEIEVIQVVAEFEMRREDVEPWLEGECSPGCKSLGTGPREKLPPYETLRVTVDGRVEIEEGDLPDQAAAEPP